MKYGVIIFLTDYSITPVALGRALEERGFESVFLPEHTHIPTSRKSPWGGGPELPKMYYDVFDPFVSLAAIAATTATLKLGTGICLVVERDPIVLAKEISTLDRISDGRFLFGVGGGWNAEEMAHHGTAFETRFELMAERIDAMKAIWTNSKPEYHGTFVDFEEMMTWPKPVQKPHPPVLVGGAFPYGARRAIEYGDAWMPIAGRQQDIVDLLPKFRQMAAEAGRDPDSLPVTMFLPAAEADTLARMRDAGAERAVLELLPEDEATCLARLDELAELARKVG